MSYVDRVNVRLLPPEIRGEPEAQAMLGAFWSRSQMPIEERLKTFDDISDLKNKLQHIVVGYGHSSLLDMANVAIFIERIPILAAVAIENHAMFAGQETSTRYVDWGTEEFINPFAEVGTDWLADEGGVARTLHVLHKYLRETYVAVAEGMFKRLWNSSGGLIAADETDGGIDPAAAKRAMKARAFDVARGFLPAAAVTNVCWSGRLSSILAHLSVLLIHPDHTIVDIARKIHTVLHDAFPKVVPVDMRSEDAKYAEAYWFGPMSTMGALEPALLTMTGDDLNRYGTTYKRQRKERVPPSIGARVDVMIQSWIDYGSFRDLNRHRVGYKDVYPPDLVADIHPWYIEMAGDSLPADFTNTLKHLQNRFSDAYFEASRDIDKYYPDYVRYENMLAYGAPLGVLVPVNYKMDLAQYIYLVELRSGIDVHPTLRKMIHEAHADFKNFHSKGINIQIHADERPDPGFNGFMLSRGGQTILIGGQAI